MPAHTTRFDTAQIIDELPNFCTSTLPKSSRKYPTFTLLGDFLSSQQLLLITANALLTFLQSCSCCLVLHAHAKRKLFVASSAAMPCSDTAMPYLTLQCTCRQDTLLAFCWLAQMDMFLTKPTSMSVEEGKAERATSLHTSWPHNHRRRESKTRLYQTHQWCATERVQTHSTAGLMPTALHQSGLCCEHLQSQQSCNFILKCKAFKSMDNTAFTH